MKPRSAALLPLLLAGLCAGCSAFRRPVWEQPPPPTRDAPVVQPGSLHRAELENGLELIVLEDHRLPRVVMGVTVRRGEAIVPPDQAGLALFTADLMERGAGERGELALAQAVDELGASMGVGATWDSMSARVSGLSPDLEPLLDILADVVLRPRFEAAEARRTRDEMVASLEQAVDEPTALARWNLSRTLYGSHRFAEPMMGTPETVARLDAAAARRFHEKVFVPNGAIFFASGDVKMDDVLERVGKAFGAWTPGTVPDPGPPPPSPAPPARRVVLVDRPDLVQAQIVIGHEGIDRRDPRRIAAGLMNDVLGGGSFSSRLIQALRTQAGLTYSAGSSFSLRRQPGPFVASTFTRIPKVRRTIDLTLQVIEGMREHPPTEKELRDARALLVGEFSLGLESSAAVLGALVNLEVHDLPPDSLDTYRRRVRETTSEETARAARELLHPERAAIVVVGPADKIAPQLDGLGPVEVVTP